MFMSIVDAGLCLLLVLTGGAALYAGLFKAHRETTPLGLKTLYGLLSYGASGTAWFFIYIVARFR